MEKRVGFGPRLGAFIIDIILLGILATLLSFTFLRELIEPLIKLDYLSATMNEMEIVDTVLDHLDEIIAASIPLAFVGIFYWLIEGLTGASPGKMVLGLKIGKEEGRQADMGVYLIRFVLKNIQSLLNIAAALVGSLVLSVLGGVSGFIIFIGCFLVLGTRKQAIHDMIAKTAVFQQTDLNT